LKKRKRNREGEREKRERERMRIRSIGEEGETERGVETEKEIVLRAANESRDD
jgi:hypothetical protein